MSKDKLPFFQLFSLLLFIVLQNILFFQPVTPLGIGLQISSWVILVFLSLTTKKTLPLALVAGGVMLAQLYNTTQVGSLTSQFLTILTLLVTAGIAMYSLARSRRWLSSFSELLLSPLLLFTAYLQTSLATYFDRQFPFTNLFALVAKIPLLRHLKSILLGLVLGIPIVVVLTSMFVSADVIFADFIHNFTDITLPERLQERLIYSLILFLLATPLLQLATKEEFISPVLRLKKWSLINEMTIVMTLVAITVGAFLVVQWPYVFVHVEKETSLSEFGVATYSEYVRQGFEELLKVAAILFGLIWFGLTIWRNRQPAQKPYLLGIQLVVLGELGIFLLSLFRRVWLYQSFHGWTLTKLYGTWLLIGLIGFILTLAARHFWSKRWIKVEVIWLVGWLLFGSWWNAEHFIIRSGHLPTVNERQDFVYLSRMSSDGYEGWVQSYGWANEVLNRQLNTKNTGYTAADRQEIAYAARVVTELSRSYDTLVAKQASDEEFITHYRTLLSYTEQEQWQKQKHLDALFTPLDARTQQDKSTSPEPQPYRLLLSDVRDNLQVTNTQITTILELKKLVDKKPLEREKIAQFKVPDFIPISFDGEWLGENCREVMGDQMCFDPTMTFYNQYNFTYERIKSMNRNAPLYKLLTQNSSELAAYQKMQQDIPYDELLRLQSKYFELKRRIQRQPKEERLYEQDVSYNSPLIW